MNLGHPQGMPLRWMVVDEFGAPTRNALTVDGCGWDWAPTRDAPTVDGCGWDWAPTRDAPTVDDYGICNTSSVHRMGFSMMYSAIFSYARWSRMMCS